MAVGVGLAEHKKGGRGGLVTISFFNAPCEQSQFCWLDFPISTMLSWKVRTAVVHAGHGEELRAPRPASWGICSPVNASGGGMSQSTLSKAGEVVSRKKAPSAPSLNKGQLWDQVGRCQWGARAEAEDWGRDAPPFCWLYKGQGGSLVFWRQCYQKLLGGCGAVQVVLE